MSEQNPGKSGLRGRRSGDRKLTPRTGPGSAVWYILAVFLLLALGQAFYFTMQGGKEISYSEFKQLVREGSVQDVVVAEDRVRGKIKSDGQARPFVAVRIEDPKLLEDLERAGIKFTGEAPNKWLAEIVGWIIPIILLVALWSFFFRRMGGAEGGVMQL